MRPKQVMQKRVLRYVLRAALLGALMPPATLAGLVLWQAGCSPGAVLLPSVAALASGMVASSLAVR